MRGEVEKAVRKAVEPVEFSPIKRWKKKGLRLRRGTDRKFIDEEAESTSRSKSSELSRSAENSENREDSEEDWQTEESAWLGHNYNVF